MAGFEVLVKQSVARDLRHIPQDHTVRILKRLRALSDEPRPAGVEKLSGMEKYRIRQGFYRIIFEIRDEERVIVVVKVGRRREVYRSS